MTKEIELFLEPDGFYAGQKLKNGRLGKGAHKITEEEILIMFGTLVRTYYAKTGNNTMLIGGDDGNAVVARLIKQSITPETE